jgi:hypothetical protein
MNHLSESNLFLYGIGNQGEGIDRIALASWPSPGALISERTKVGLPVAKARGRNGGRCF